jgi:hypothetical protein
VLSLSLPKDIGKAVDQRPLRLDFGAVCNTLTELNALIEDFNGLFLEVKTGKIPK